MSDLYVCPTCKTKNDEYQKYCPKCGTWLLSTAYPAIKVEKKKRAIRKISTSVLIAIIIIGALAYFGFNNREPFGDTAAATTFGTIEVGEKYTLSQLTVDRTKPSAVADFTTHSELKDDPLEISAVFYDKDGKRLGKATSLIDKPMAIDQTTTITFTFEEAAGLDRINNVRIEITPLSPLDLLERVADKASKLPQK